MPSRCGSGSGGGSFSASSQAGQVGNPDLAVYGATALLCLLTFRSLRATFDLDKSLGEEVRDALGEPA